MSARERDPFAEQDPFRWSDMLFGLYAWPACAPPGEPVAVRPFGLTLARPDAGAEHCGHGG